MKKEDIENQLKNVGLGDLVLVEWADASIGKSNRIGAVNVGIDVRACSWGIYIGLLGQNHRHIVLAQNNFKYTDGFYDIDYTAIPLSLACKISVLLKSHINIEVAKQLLQSFLAGGSARISKSRGHQERLRIHE